MTATAPDTHALADRTRAGIVEALGHGCAHAHRVPAIVKRFDCDPPTPWDKAHDWLNWLLTLLDTARD